jgi:DeoR/GlpR family transcriptional regulator of sugar metabolism
MLVVERQNRALELLRTRGSEDLETLAAEMGVSVSTVRRDLDALETQGLIERTHGGAVYRGPQQRSLVFSERMGEQVPAKQAIGAYAAAMVQPHMTVLLDGGSTVYYAAQQIKARPLQVVTNSLSIATLFADDEQIELVLIGGYLYPRTNVLLGPIATRCLSNLHADLLLFSLAGLYEDGGYNQNLTMAEVERVMLQQAARSVMLMDASKFGRKSLARVCGIEDVSMIVSDEAVSQRWVNRCGDRLVLASGASRPVAENHRPEPK